MTKPELIAWAKAILARGSGAAPHELLQLKPNSDANAASDAFMKLARVAHPDLHRNSLNATEFDQLVLAYSRVAGAYQELRTKRVTAQPITVDPASPLPPPGAPIASAPPSRPTPPPGNPAEAMNSKALVYFRKAELGVRQGDLRGALLQLKMAIAADPQSTVLRTALGQVEAELKKPKT